MEQPKSGEILFIDEVLEKVANSTFIEGRSVRITGKLDDHNVTACIAMVTDPNTGKRIHIDTRLIEPFQARMGSLFQFIGEVDCLHDSYDVLVKARVVRCVDGLDMTMFRKAIEAQRQYHELRIAS